MDGVQEKVLYSHTRFLHDSGKSLCHSAISICSQHTNLDGINSIGECFFEPGFDHHSFHHQCYSTCWNRGSTIRLTWTLRIMSLLSCHFSSFAQLVLVVITYYFSSLFSDSRRSSLATVLPVACGGDHFRKLWLYWWSLSAGTGISHGYAAYSKVFFNLVICTAMSFSSCRQHDWDAVACSR